MTTVKRSLSAILNKLCSVEYIGQKNPSNEQFYLAKNGLKLKKNIVESMSLGRMDLEIVSNVLSTNYFNENYHDLVFVFNSNIGFEPSLHYLRKLEKIFPTNRLFKVVNVYNEELN